MDEADEADEADDADEARIKPDGMQSRKLKSYKMMRKFFFE